MKATATLRQREGSDWLGGSQHIIDNTNDMAISPFNTCLANTITMKVTTKIKVAPDQI